MAYFAYKNWIRRNGIERALPGLQYNQQQLFWISFAQTWCDVSNDYYNRYIITADEHAPSEFRVKGVVSNMQEFAQDFNCPIGSKMNPMKKCNIW